MDKQNIPTTLRAANTPATVVCHDIARLRWPDYRIEGSGNIAVVLHCCRKVVLVDFVLVGRQLVAQKCGPYCRIDDNPRWHRGYSLDDVPQEKRYRSFHRLPGWDED